MANSLMAHPHILIVDDEFGMRDGLKRTLEPEGFKTDTAADGETALAKGLKKEYDIYLLDLQLPDMDGIEILSAVRNKFPEAICIIMTAYGSIASAVEATKIGAYAYITKPFNPDELLVELNRATERRWYILEARRLREEQSRRLLEIAYEQSRLKTVINSISDGLLIINQDNEPVLYNRPVIKLLEIDKPLMIGAPVLSMLPASLAEQIKNIAAHPADNQGIQLEIVIQPPAEKVVIANITPIKDERNAFMGVVVVIRDITAMKKVELVKNQFVNMVAHELKAPIAAIMGYLDIVANRTLGDNPEIYAKYLNRCLERAGALKDLVNDLLNISRIETGTVKREIVTVEIREIAEELLEFFEQEALEKNIKTVLSGDKKVTLNADKEEIRRILTNLISNGIKYNRPNGQLKVNLRKVGNNVEIAVKDTGIGMSADEVKNLFNEFYRAKNKMTRDIPGTGLGLSIVKRIAESYHGTVSVESEPGQGSVFTVTLPSAETSKQSAKTGNA